MDAVDILNDVINKLKEENERLKKESGDRLVLLNNKGNDIKQLTEENERLKHRIYLKDRIEQWPLWKILGADHTLVIKGSILDRLIKTTAKLDKLREILPSAGHLLYEHTIITKLRTELEDK